MAPRMFPQPRRPVIGEPADGGRRLGRLGWTRPKRLGEQIRRWRVQRGLSQQALADAAGLSWIYIAKLEAGDRVSPSMPALERLAKALGVRVRVTLAN